MSGWNKVKKLFWQSEDAGAPNAAPPPPEAEPAGDPDFAQFLADTPEPAAAPAAHAPVARAAPAVDPHGATALAPPAATVPLGPMMTMPMVGPPPGLHVGGAPPDGDEIQEEMTIAPDVEDLERIEKFVARLPSTLPHAAKLAAALAYLEDRGKDPAAVLREAEGKIARLRENVQLKEAEMREAVAREQGDIDALQARIAEHQQRIADIGAQFEGVRQSCLNDEARVEAARAFFGQGDPAAAAG